MTVRRWRSHFPRLARCLVPARRYLEGMEQENGEHEDRYFDPALQMTVTHSGKARAREQLEAAQRGTDWAALRARVGLAPKRA